MDQTDSLTTASLTSALTRWLPDRRWFVRSEPRIEVEILEQVLLPADDAEDPDTRALVVRAGSGREHRDYQVPIVLRPGTPVPPEDPALIGSLVHQGTDHQIIDATCDEAGRRALLGLLLRPAGASPGMQLVPASVRSLGTPVITGTRLLDGEQSNSSMIIELEEGSPIIMKLFRVLQDGANPDVEVQDALDSAGSPQIAPMVGAVSLHREGRAASHSLLAQRFLPAVQDAWRVAVDRAVRGEDFSQEARDLGVATAQVHQTLARVLPTVAADEETRSALVQGMLDRLRTVGSLVPQVARHENSLADIMRRAQDVPWPPLQRIHGDYHLGQVLSVPHRGWVLLDFEGEPLRSLEERSAPDVALRDVAGMLRSLDYVSGAAQQDHDVEARDWSSSARTSFWEGYLAESGLVDGPDVQVLLCALEADKAVYEALYEVRHRPGWLGIPLAAIERISGSDAAAG